MKKIKMFRQGQGTLAELNELVNDFLEEIAGYTIDKIDFQAISRGEYNERTNVYVVYEVVNEQ